MPKLKCCRCKKCFDSKNKNKSRNVSTSGYSHLQDKLLEDNITFSTTKPTYLCSACERFYRRKNNEKKSLHQGHKSTTQEPRKRKQSEIKIPLEQCCTIPDQLTTCFICGSTLSNKSVIVPINARLDLFIEHDIYVSTEQKCCSQHLVGSHLNPDLIIDTSNYKEASLTSFEAMELVMHMKGELKRRRYFRFKILSKTTN